MDSLLSSPYCYILFVMACFVLAVIFLISLALLCIHLNDRLEPKSPSVDVEALLEECCDNRQVQEEGPLAAMRVLSGASLLTVLAPKSIRSDSLDITW